MGGTRCGGGGGRRVGGWRVFTCAKCVPNASSAAARQRPRETGIYLARESRCHEGTVRLAYGDDVHARMTTSLAPGAVQALKDQLAFLCAWGHVTQSFDVDAWIDPQPLQRAQARLAAGLLTVE